MRKSFVCKSLIAGAALSACATAHAEMISYELIFVIESGTFNGMDVSGETITARGSINDETDLIDQRDDIGGFASTTTYSAEFGTITVDDVFMQFQSGVNSQYGLLAAADSLNDAIRFQDNSGISPMQDPNVPEATGSFRYDDGGPFGEPRTIMGNGNTLVISVAAYTPDGDNVNVFPAPGALAALGLGGLLAARRRR